ncbi:angio-associated migratory cell protein-like [Oppia nitens]|uniref:angio-associated migratory cell protein-like n=1 Tax=Oppia nitens TaxID=1686743 RepID=UPI0023DB14AE|nr:angio-associated migratory cell protein-like [Oppia nitens]
MINDASRLMDDNTDDIDDNFIDDTPDDDIEIIESEDIDGLNSSDEEAHNDNEEATAVVDESVNSFAGHQKAVLCCDLSSDNAYVVSGGEDDMAFVWRTQDMSVVFDVNGHKDSVVCVEFNANNSLVATADMSGLIQVYDMTGAKLFDFEVDEINWMLWHPMANNILLAGTSAGDAWMWKLVTTSLTFECKTFQSFGKSNVTAKCLPDGKRIVMGYDDGVVRIWDLKNVNVIHAISDLTAHTATITSLDCMPDNILIASASVDSTAKLINSQTGKVVATFQCGADVAPVADAAEDTEELVDSVECVRLNSSLSVLATGTVEGSIDIWDISTQIKRHSCKHSSGVSKLSWDTNSPHILYTAGLDGIINIYDGRSGQLVGNKKGHLDQILDMKISKDSTIAVTASEDNCCKIFSLP